MKIILPTLFLALFLSGCFNSEAPKCSDTDVEVTVKDIYANIVHNAQNNSQNIFLTAFTKTLPKSIDTLSSSRAIAYDDNIKLRSCKADALLDTNKTVEILYTVQLNEENSGEFYVELDTGFVETLVQQNLMREVFKKTN